MRLPRVIRTIREMREYVRSLQHPDSLGFVPTMGYLHRGHQSLIDHSNLHCKHTCVSIFVNPTQFAAHEDLDKYPRDLESDLKKIGDRAEVVFAPSVTEMYPSPQHIFVMPFDARSEEEKAENVGSSTIEYDENRMPKKPKNNLIDNSFVFTSFGEGATRPQFLRGVCTVVNKLFNIVTPTVAFFGQKDIMQATAVRKMVQDLHMQTRIEVCPIVRERDGLALSSRNAYLSEEERKLASCLFQALFFAQTLWIHMQERRRAVLEEGIRFHIGNIAKNMNEQMPNPTHIPIDIEYLSFADIDTLQEIRPLAMLEEDKGAVVSLAVKLGNVRLIDNMTIGPFFTPPRDRIDPPEMEDDDDEDEIGANDDDIGADSGHQQPPSSSQP